MGDDANPSDSVDVLRFGGTRSDKEASNPADEAATRDHALLAYSGSHAARPAIQLPEENLF
jgi:hypothetical protein